MCMCIYIYIYIYTYVYMSPTSIAHPPRVHLCHAPSQENELPLLEGKSLMQGNAV